MDDTPVKSSSIRLTLLLSLVVTAAALAMRPHDRDLLPYSKYFIFMYFWFTCLVALTHGMLNWLLTKKGFVLFSQILLIIATFFLALANTLFMIAFQPLRENEWIGLLYILIFPLLGYCTYKAIQRLITAIRSFQPIDILTRVHIAILTISLFSVLPMLELLDNFSWNIAGSTFVGIFALGLILLFA